MKRVVRKNQVVLTLLAVMIAVAGYLNYTGRFDGTKGKTDGVAANAPGESGGISDADILAENQAAGSLVDVDAFPEDGSGDGDGHEDISGPIQTVNDGNSPSASPGEAILTNGVSVADYVSAVRLNREQVRARNRETLLTVINNASITEEMKQEAVETMVEMTKTAELENTAETLLSAKGFEDSVVSINGQSVDVVVCRYAVSDAERAQIEDIIERKTGFGVENIVITLMSLAEE